MMKLANCDAALIYDFIIAQRKIKPRNMILREVNVPQTQGH